MIRLVHLLRRKAGLSLEAFRAHAADRQGPLVSAHQMALGLVRHVQTHRDPTATEADDRMRAARGMAATPLFDGIAEYWWNSEADLAAAFASASGQSAHAALVAGEAEHVDLAASPLWFAHEYPQVSIQHHRAVARTRSGLLKLHFALQPLPPQSVAEAQRYWVTCHGPLVRSYAMARGMVCYQQVHCTEQPLLDRLRSARDTRAPAYMGHAEAWFDRTSARTGPDIDAAAAAALADEANFIDWPRSTLFSGKEYVFVDRDWA